MEFSNIKVLIKPDETLQDVIAELCDEGDIGPDEPFAFGAIITPDKDNPEYRWLKLNCLVDMVNPYTARHVATNLLTRKVLPPNGVIYLQPPLDQWLNVFRPLLLSMVSKVESRYHKLIPDRDDLLSILYMTILTLYNKGYYLHNTLIYKSYINALNLECRKTKHFQNSVSLDAPTRVDESGQEVTLKDQLVDPAASDWVRRVTTYCEEDFWEDKFELLKAKMLEDMSELQFTRILIQLASNTIDRSTSYKLDKYRQIFAPDNIPRPNSKGRNKGGTKQ